MNLPGMQIGCVRLVLAASLSVASARASSDAMTCTEAITLPGSYSMILWHLPVTTEVKVEIGTQGRARRVVYNTPVKQIAVHLDQYFKDGARYSDKCRGRTITFSVEYVVQGVALDFPVSEVRFMQPDRFVVTVHPIKPSLDPVRPGLK